jgi:hypothetical protein
MKSQENNSYKPFSFEIRKFLGQYHAGCLNGEECISCNSACCSQGGFAILENIVLIYQMYEQGLLKRNDYEFRPGRSFGDFVFTYFDARTYSIGAPPMSSEMVFFHMRNLDFENRPIRVPEEGSYWEARYRLFAEDPGLNHGCVFLSEKIPHEHSGDENTQRHCILHVRQSPDHLTAKPIDCLLFACVERQAEKTEQWFTLLSRSYPDSIGRFKKLLFNADSARH